MIEYILIVLYLIACLVLILFVLLQPGKSDAAQVFGGGASSTAFGPRGTQTVLAKVTVGAAIVFFIIAFLFSIPGLIGKKPLGRSVTPSTSQPAAPLSAPGVPPAGDQGSQPAPAAAPSAPSAPGSDAGGSQSTKPQDSKAAPKK